MSTTIQRHETHVRPEPAELPGLAHLLAELEGLSAEHMPAMLVGPGGETIPLPDSAFRALAVVVDAMSRGQTITLIPVGQELTTQQAAEILHVSRPHLTKLLEAGAIPFHKVGTHRRIAIEDVLTYRERRAVQRADALRELGDLSQELGAYRQT